ncbi:MAG: glycoside hydrolase [Gammaproteobacteria bacterium]|nr:glycoside hydrolase [Gammaproteobacteria bacterium]
MTGTADPRLRVVICWHLHQPQYRDLAAGTVLRPWVYLHALRDYVDLAMRLESCPEAAAVVAFSPVLLEQLDDYCGELARHLQGGAPLGDPVLALLAAGGVPADRREWPALVRACLSAHRVLRVERHASYRQLADFAMRLLEHDALAYASPQLMTDLAAWFHLAWCGEGLREGDPRARDLVEQGRDFTPAQLRSLLECIADALSGVVPRFRRLAGNGQIELAVSPWGHPILPLMLGFSAARETAPGLALPDDVAYPGGEDRARWHLARAVQVFTRTFGLRPRGCWPPEGALSDRVVALMPAFGFDWVASGESVLERSLPDAAAQGDGDPWHRAYAVGSAGTTCFFRDDELSDRVGFTYGRWDAAGAADDLVARLERIAATAGPDAVVPLMLDGDNVFEYYPGNGQEFVAALYARLAAHPALRLTTFSQCLVEGIESRPLPRLVAGSWIRGSLASWIGNPGRNRAWASLCEAKRMYDQVMVEGNLDERAEQAAEQLLGICEGSDWFWRFDEDEDPGTLDPLFRRHLLNLYAALGEAPPSPLTDVAG